MEVTEIEVRGLRNLTSVEIKPASAVNLVVGPNGSGKTSLLEAIHLLGLARSFRSSQARKLIQHGSKEMVVFGRVEGIGTAHRIGIRKELDGATNIRVDEQNLKAASRLAEILPLQVLTPEVVELLQGEPRERRAFMDWGLFHVEHDYHGLWRTYFRVLEQRNAGLRYGLSTPEMNHWDEKLSELGEDIAQRRKSYIDNLTPVFLSVVKEFLPDLNLVAIIARTGWTKDQCLLEVLQRNKQVERERGTTLFGVQRGDFKIMSDIGADIVPTLSRGQLKLVAAALKIAQIKLLLQTTGKQCTILADDIISELDVAKQGILFTTIADTRAQCFYTAVNESLVELASNYQSKLFHVERGIFSEVL